MLSKDVNQSEDGEECIMVCCHQLLSIWITTNVYEYKFLTWQEKQKKIV